MTSNKINIDPSKLSDSDLNVLILAYSNEIEDIDSTKEKIYKCWIDACHEQLKRMKLL